MERLTPGTPLLRLCTRHSRPQSRIISRSSRPQLISCVLSQQAEEEEAARQAELARIQAEEDARKAAEDEQKAQEETERLESEQPFANEFRGDLKNDLDYEIKKISDALEWAAFLKCYSKPDVRYEADITAYMASLKELEVDDMKQALNTATDCEEIVRDLREIWCECKVGASELNSVHSPAHGKSGVLATDRRSMDLSAPGRSCTGCNSNHIRAC